MQANQVRVCWTCSSQQLYRSVSVFVCKCHESRVAYVISEKKSLKRFRNAYFDWQALTSPFWSMECAHAFQPPSVRIFYYPIQLYSPSSSSLAAIDVHGGRWVQWETEVFPCQRAPTQPTRAKQMLLFHNKYIWYIYIFYWGNTFSFRFKLHENGASMDDGDSSGKSAAHTLLWFRCCCCWLFCRNFCCGPLSKSGSTEIVYCGCG